MNDEFNRRKDDPSGYDPRQDRAWHGISRDEFGKLLDGMNGASNKHEVWRWVAGLAAGAFLAGFSFWATAMYSEVKGMRSELNTLGGQVGTLAAGRVTMVEGELLRLKERLERLERHQDNPIFRPGPK